MISNEGKNAYNPLGLKVGDKVVSYKGTPKERKVFINRFSKNRIFAIVSNSLTDSEEYSVPMDKLSQ